MAIFIWRHGHRSHIWIPCIFDQFEVTVYCWWFLKKTNDWTKKWNTNEFVAKRGWCLSCIWQEGRSIRFRVIHSVKKRVFFFDKKVCTCLRRSYNLMIVRCIDFLSFHVLPICNDWLTIFLLRSRLPNDGRSVDMRQNENIFFTYAIIYSQISTISKLIENIFIFA